ncbi:hypothetical protein GF324_07905, partial [bacterium]|nr:hypothetical protein [bacterium]
NEYSATVPASFHSDGDVIGWAVEAEDQLGATSRLPSESSEWFYYNVYDPALDVPVHEVVYRWQDVAASGTNLNLSNRQVVEVVFSDYGFDSFTWYGQSCDTIWVSANGWVSFSRTDAEVSGFPAFPDRRTPNNVVALFAHLFDVDSNGDIYVGTDDGNFVIQYENVYFAGTSVGTTGQIVLSPSTEGVYLNYETADASWSYDYDAGFENGNGDLGDTIQRGTNWAPVESGTSFRIGHQLGTLTGTITDQDTDPLDNVEVNINQSGSLVKSGYSETDGTYTVTELLAGTYDVTAFLPGYTTGSQSGVVITSGQSTTQNFQLAQQIQNVQITGTVESADSPGTMISGITVSIPALGISDVTAGDGSFDLGTQPEGLYTIEIGHSPAGSQGYHDAVYSGVDVSSSTVPLDLQVFEILAPTNLNASVGNERVTLTWNEPANHAGQVLNNGELRRQIEQRQEMVDRAYRIGGERDQVLIQPIERELHMLRSMLAMREIESGNRPPNELDDVGDFQYYRIRQDGVIKSYQPVQEAITITGLENFREYSFEVAADYGYGQQYLEFSTSINARPNGGVQYDLTEQGSWQWVEINPDNGGSGTPLNLNYNQTSSFISLGTLDYEHYGEAFTQLAVSSNGWISFLSSVVGYTGTLPSTSSPNAVLAPFWMNLDPGTGTNANVWYLVDEPNDRVIVQWLADTYPGPNNRRKSFQVILDCANNHATFNYESAVSGWTIDNGVSVGIEDRYGTAAVTLQRSNISNQSSWRFEPSGVVFGNIAGTVTATVGGAAIDSAIVQLTGYPDLTDTTDSNGEYAFFGLDRSQAPYEVVVTRFGFQESSASGIGDPWGPDFEITQNFSLDAATAPSAFNLTALTNEDTSDTREPTLTWEEATSSDPNDPVTYDLIYAVDDINFTSADTIAGLSNESYTFGPGVLTNYTTVYWYVHAKDSNTAGTLSTQNPVDGTTWSFYIHEPFPPNAFDLNSPANEAVIADDATVTLEWNATTDPEGQDVTYRVFVSTTEGQLGTRVATGLTGTTYDYTGEDDTEYFWTVRAVDTVGDYTQANQTNSFTISIPEAPAAFNLTGPGDGVRVNTTTPMLTWQAAVDPDDGDVVTYTLEWAKHSDFSDVTQVTGLSATQYTFAGGALSNGDDVYWRVKAVDTNTSGTWANGGMGNHWAFSVLLNNLPNAFSLTAPSNGFSIPGGSQQFSWERNGDPNDPTVSYTVEFDSMSNFSTKQTFGPYDESTYLNLDTDSQAWIMEDSTYYWRVFAEDASEPGGTYSTETWTFVKAVPDSPLVFDLLTPTNGQVMNTLGPTLEWNSTTDPDPDDTDVSYNLIYDIDDSGFNSPDTVFELSDTSYTFEESALLGAIRNAYGFEGGTPGLDDLLPDDVTVYWYV